MTINTQKLRAYRQSLKRGVSNTGHGHVFMRPDGLLARCGGPALCAECAKDLALLMSTEGYEPPTTDDLVDTIDAQAAEIERFRSMEDMLRSLPISTDRDRRMYGKGYFAGSRKRVPDLQRALCKGVDVILEKNAEIERLREAAKMLADWAEHEVGAEPDLTPGLAEVRAALSGESNGG